MQLLLEGTFLLLEDKEMKAVKCNLKQKKEQNKIIAMDTYEELGDGSIIYLSENALQRVVSLS